jgi:hypothetical protein
MISKYEVLKEFLDSSDLDLFIDNYARHACINYTDTILKLKTQSIAPNTIDDAFTWENTDEGHEYWSDLNSAFVDNYEDYVRKAESKYLNLLPI